MPLKFKEIPACNERPETDAVKPIKKQHPKTKADLLAEMDICREQLREKEKELKNLERYKQYAETADEMSAMKDAFVNSGFTNEEAFQLLITMVNSAAKLGR